MEATGQLGHESDQCGTLSLYTAAKPKKIRRSFYLQEQSYLLELLGLDYYSPSTIELQQITLLGQEKKSGHSHKDNSAELE